MLPEGVEVPRIVVDSVMRHKVERESDESNKPIMPKGQDYKCRYMWRIGMRPSVTRFEVL